jgi:glyoxylase-like metal-dependent hydrolase (beta-lactamase superfamily II)
MERVIETQHGLSYVDLHFRGVPRIIATGVLQGPGGVALVDPGPSTTLQALEAGLSSGGLRLDDVDTVLLTHIHLDHAGSVGRLVRQYPDLTVYVHERGAPHLIDPSRLVASATRLYGDAMDALWGEVAAVPPSAIVSLAGGEEIDVAGRRLTVAYTPGHASHHVSYAALDAGVAFVGDSAGVCLRPGGYVMPPTPPPDIDIERWMDTLTVIERWNCPTLFMTHFGPHDAEGGALLDRLAVNLRAAGDLVLRSLAREGADEERERWFAEQVREVLWEYGGTADVGGYEVAGRFDLNWQGLARYWRKKAE